MGWENCGRKRTAAALHHKLCANTILLSRVQALTTVQPHLIPSNLKLVIPSSLSALQEAMCCPHCKWHTYPSTVSPFYPVILTLMYRFSEVENRGGCFKELPGRGRAAPRGDGSSLCFVGKVESAPLSWTHFLSEKLAKYLTCQFPCFLCSWQHHHHVKCDDNSAQHRELAKARTNVAERLFLFFLRPWKLPNVSFGSCIWKDFLSLFSYPPPFSFPCLIHNHIKLLSPSGHEWHEADGFCLAVDPCWQRTSGSIR